MYDLLDGNPAMKPTCPIRTVVVSVWSILGVECRTNAKGMHNRRRSCHEPRTDLCGRPGWKKAFTASLKIYDIQMPHPEFP